MDKTFVRLYDKKTGMIEDKQFENKDAAWKAYWDLSENSPAHVDIELITTNQG